MQSEALFPREVTGKVPRLTLTGHELLEIEQHQGLVAYQPDVMQLRSSVGILQIEGAGLCFRRYTGNEAVITGRIDRVHVLCRGERTC